LLARELPDDVVPSFAQDLEVVGDKQDGRDESRRSLQSIFASRQPSDIVFVFVAQWCYGEGFGSISDSFF
jgi:hypothetical protein